MADLKDLSKYLTDRIRVLHECEQRLDSLQHKFESFNAEVQGARETELDQLVAIATENPGSLPEDFKRSITDERPGVEKEFDEKLRVLEERRSSLGSEAEKLRQTSARDEAVIRNRNLSLDEEEEKLKLRSTALLGEIEQHNERIASLGRSFGFFSNFFSMRRLAHQKEVLEAEQKDILARIEQLRRAWRETDQEHAAREDNRLQRALGCETDAAAVAAKIEALNSQRTRIVARSTVANVLTTHRHVPPEGDTSDPPCPRCGMPNPPPSHFCHICAQRLRADRPDLDGSLQEFAELDHHARRFGEGMHACQALIGLVRGMKSGLEGLKESVEEMLASQSKHNLKKLQLEIPQWSRDFGARFDDLHALAHKKMRLHPLELAKRISEQTDIVFTEEYIKAYFELIGKSMSDAAEAQWGS